MIYKLHNNRLVLNYFTFRINTIVVRKRTKKKYRLEKSMKVDLLKTDF